MKKGIYGRIAKVVQGMVLIIVWFILHWQIAFKFTINMSDGRGDIVIYLISLLGFLLLSAAAFGVSLLISALYIKIAFYILGKKDDALFAAFDIFIKVWNILPKKINKFMKKRHVKI